MYRSSHRRYSVREVGLRNFVKFTGKHLCQSLFFNKVAGLRPATLLKKRLWHRCFPVNFAKFLRPTSLTENLRWLLLILFSKRFLFHKRNRVMHLIINSTPVTSKHVSNTTFFESTQLAPGLRNYNTYYYFYFSYFFIIYSQHQSLQKTFGLKKIEKNCHRNIKIQK